MSNWNVLRIFVVNNEPMKYLFYLLIPVLSLTACSQSSETTEEENTELEGDHYGPKEVKTGDAISVSDMLEAHAKKGKKAKYTFEGTITEVCSKAGCWVNVDDGQGGTFMVRFKDHFTIPTETEVGTKAIFHGEAFDDEVSVELLQHFAEDAGKSQEEIDAITEPEQSLGFTADGVFLMKK